MLSVHMDEQIQLDSSLNVDVFGLTVAHDLRLQRAFLYP